MMAETKLRFHEHIIQIKTEDSTLIHFIESYFKPIIQQDAPNAHIEVFFEKTDLVSFNKIASLKIDSQKYQKISRQIIQSGSSIILKEINQFPGLKLIFNLENKKLKIYGYYISSNGLINQLKSRLFKKQADLKLNLYLKYFLVLFPAIWYNENFKDRFLLHASAISIKNKVILFPGLGGVGKSTLTLASLAYENVSFISDNLVLSDGSSVYPVYEAIALDSRSLTLIGEALKKLEKLNIPMSHNRQFYRVKGSTMEQGNVQAMFFVKFCDRFKISALNSDQALSRLIAINTIAREVAAYNDLSATLNLAEDNRIPFNKSSTFKSLVDGTECYELCIKPGSDLREPISTVLDMVQNGNTK